MGTFRCDKGCVPPLDEANLLSSIIASAAASESRRQRRVDERMAEKTCFACRQKGHAAKDCPSNSELGGKRPVTGVCYRLGERFHIPCLTFIGAALPSIHSPSAGNPSTRPTHCHSPLASYAKEQVTWRLRVLRTKKASILMEGRANFVARLTIWHGFAHCDQLHVSTFILFGSRV